MSQIYEKSKEMETYILAINLDNLILREERIQSAINYSYGFIGTPYKWGGENPIEGYDCSGFVQEILRSVGMDPPGNQTAHFLWVSFKHCRNLDMDKFGPEEKPRGGALAFYGKTVGFDRRITHVAFCINSTQVIEAGGGGRHTRSRDDAARDDAFVRIRPIAYRKDLGAVLMPDY